MMQHLNNLSVRILANFLLLSFLSFSKYCLAFDFPTLRPSPQFEVYLLIRIFRPPCGRIVKFGPHRPLLLMALLMKLGVAKLTSRFSNAQLKLKSVRYLDLGKQFRIFQLHNL